MTALEMAAAGLGWAAFGLGFARNALRRDDTPRQAPSVDALDKRAAFEGLVEVAGHTCRGGCDRSCVAELRQVALKALTSKGGEP